MRKLMLSAAAIAAILVLPTQALAGDEVTDRTNAIALCRAEVASQTGLAADEVRFDQVQVRTRLVRVDLDVWRGGQLTNIRCDVRRGDELTIAAINPPLTAQTAAR